MDEAKSEVQVTRKKRYQPTDEDYELTRIGIEEASNGVVISCGYKLKESIKDKLKKQQAEGGPYMSDYCDDEKHVFETKQDAKKFIDDELDSMWQENKDE